jgi:soluble lytic murein transglycosylase-like protein
LAIAKSARAESVRDAPAPPVAEAELPLVLAPGDSWRYRRIFALQGAGRWVEADNLIPQLHDRLLIGAVEAQRLLHKAYRARYDELAAWLVHHGTEPEAQAIYALALKRHPKGARAPLQPLSAHLAARSREEERKASGRKLAPAEERQAQQLNAAIAAFAYSAPSRAELALASAEAQRLLTARRQDELRAMISTGYLRAGKVREALALALAARSPAYAAAHWQAGLVAWRNGRYDEAGWHFQQVVRVPGQATWTISAAAFWTARVALRTGQPQLYNYWLGIAAQHSRTFYGLLARRMLGIDDTMDFDTAPFTELESQMISGTRGGRRALALLQVDEPARAEAELRALAPRASSALVEALAATADRANMPALSLQLAGLLADGDGRHHALFPVPRWTPLGGFTVDRALLFAVMRQESQFETQVESNAGALGLMQLMPATAHAMAKRTGVPLAQRGGAPMRDALADPELNLALAQEYITSLMADERIQGNLVLIAAAYNCGPRVLPRWLAAADLRRDPLLFIESVPPQQTRNYIEHVLANYWIYRERLGQPLRDLDALAAGQWPIYTALDTATEPERRHAENR